MMILERFLSIGFRFHSYTEPGAGKAYEYKYYPDYMSDTHYTLIVFKHYKYKSDNNDWRLYIHNNSDVSYVESPMQISDYTDSNRNYINNKIDEIFQSEMRDNKLKELGI